MISEFFIEVFKGIQPWTLAAVFYFEKTEQAPCVPCFLMDQSESGYKRDHFTRNDFPTIPVKILGAT